MAQAPHHLDRPLLAVTLTLVFLGFLIFSSASLGLLARGGVRFSSVALPQLLFGIVGGMLALLTLSRVPYRMYRRYIPHIFVGAVLLTCLVFVPAFGYAANGARRWLVIFGVSFQPAELLKIAFVLVMAWYLSGYHSKLDDVRFALGGVGVALAVCAVPLLLQPDTGSFTILVAVACGMSIAAGVRVRHLALAGGVLVVCLAVLAFMRPYLLDRVTTFLNPGDDPRGSGYQIRQSLIAVGSGGWFGRGFGQSVQKFSYLPEPIGDSVFSVAAEEFGFVGSVLLVFLYLAFALRSLSIAARAPDRFGGLVVTGVAILILTQTFLNIGSMLGIVPLTGEPLVFVSHGGSALFLSLASIGIVLNVSRYTMRRATAV